MISARNPMSTGKSKLQLDRKRTPRKVKSQTNHLSVHSTSLFLLHVAYPRWTSVHEGCGNRMIVPEEALPEMIKDTMKSIVDAPKRIDTMTHAVMNGGVVIDIGKIIDLVSKLPKPILFDLPRKIAAAIPETERGILGAAEAQDIWLPRLEEKGTHK
jgi:hypothetical protein